MCTIHCTCKQVSRNIIIKGLKLETIKINGFLKLLTYKPEKSLFYSVKRTNKLVFL